MHRELNALATLTVKARQSGDKAAMARALDQVNQQLPDLHDHMVDCIRAIEGLPRPSPLRPASPRP